MHSLGRGRLPPLVNRWQRSSAQQLVFLVLLYGRDVEVLLIVCTGDSYVSISQDSRWCRIVFHSMVCPPGIEPFLSGLRAGGLGIVGVVREGGCVVGGCTRSLPAACVSTKNNQARKEAPARVSYRATHGRTRGYCPDRVPVDRRPPPHPHPMYATGPPRLPLRPRTSTRPTRSRMTNHIRAPPRCGSHPLHPARCPPNVRAVNRDSNPIAPRFGIRMGSVSGRGGQPLPRYHKKGGSPEGNRRDIIAP